MTEKRISWKEYEQGKFNKQPVLIAYNSKKDELGFLRYENVGRHIHWCWYQNEDIRMSPGCLQEVRDKQKELINVRKSQRGVRKR